MAIQTGIRARRLTILRAAALFDGATTRLTANPVVVIDEGRIVAVQTTVETIPEGADVVDLTGATLMPGLVDTHLHLCFDASDDPVVHLAAMDDDALRQHMAASARRALPTG